MKKIIRVIPLMAVLILGGCFSLPKGGFSVSELAGDKISSAMGLDDIALEMQALEFFALYAAYGFYGGYGYETGFAEGQGTRWHTSATDKDGGESSSDYERIFLKDMGDGSGWWRLAVENDQDSAEYEYLLGPESEFLAVRFRDPENGEIVEYIPEQTEEPESDEVAAAELEDESDEDMTSEEDMEEYENLEYSQYSLGSEKITVGAGTFTAEHMVSEYKDDSSTEDPVDIRSDWWIVESVPGGTVKYKWVNNAEGGTMDSELTELLNGQTTIFESY